MAGIGQGGSNTRLFQNVASVRPPRSAFNLSHVMKLTAGMGALYPFLCQDVLPGDVWRIGNQVACRFTPMVAPPLHEVNLKTDYFFVPNRIMWPKGGTTYDGNWEDFITGGEDGENDDVQPTWAAPFTVGASSLGDYFGLQPGVALPAGSTPLKYPWIAYNMVWNQYFRDENLQAEVSLENLNVLNCGWEKDYLTSSLPFQQRGTAPALPISGTTSAVFSGIVGTDGDLLPVYLDTAATGARVQAAQFGVGSDDYYMRRQDAGTSSDGKFAGVDSADLTNSNVVDFGDAITFNIADIRLASSIQRFLELNARAGARYIESLIAHFRVSPRDERLQRPEYIGGTRAPVIFSEVLQTSSSDTQPTPQANMAGHGITVDTQGVSTYHCEEHGWIIGVLRVMPRTVYSNGIDRRFVRRTKYDYYFPEFAGLSEQGVLNMEVYAGTNNTTNNTVWGFQGRWDEYRFARSLVTSGFRSTFDYWHFARDFNSLPPLNGNFISMADVSVLPFADQEDDTLLISVGNLLVVNRPMPAMSLPGVTRI